MNNNQHNFCCKSCSGELYPEDKKDNGYRCRYCGCFNIDYNFINISKKYDIVNSIDNKNETINFNTLSKKEELDIEENLKLFNSSSNKIETSNDNKIDKNEEVNQVLAKCSEVNYKIIDNQTKKDDGIKEIFKKDIRRKFNIIFTITIIISLCFAIINNTYGCEEKTFINYVYFIFYSFIIISISLWLTVIITKTAYKKKFNKKGGFFICSGIDRLFKFYCINFAVLFIFFISEVIKGVLNAWMP